MCVLIPIDAELRHPSGDHLAARLAAGGERPLSAAIKAQRSSGLLRWWTMLTAEAKHASKQRLDPRLPVEPFQLSDIQWRGLEPPPTLQMKAEREASTRRTVNESGLL